MNREEADDLIAALMDMTRESEDYGTWNTVKALIQAAVTPDKPAQGETVRVRIAVAVGSDGSWDVGGFGRPTAGGTTTVSTDWEASQAAINELRDAPAAPGGPCVHFIEADIPLPTNVTVEGEVVK